MSTSCDGGATGRDAVAGRGRDGGRRSRARELSLDELYAELRAGGADVDEVAPILSRWFARGDGVALYANALRGDPSAGEVVCVSFGSSSAQLEVDSPPDTLPDFRGQRPSWSFWLVGTYRPTLAPKVYIFDPAGVDVFGWRPHQPEPGTRVVKVHPPGCPPSDTMGHAFVADAESGTFYGLVSLASLRRSR